MFDVRDFSNMAIALIIVMVLASAVTVRALMSPAAELTSSPSTSARVDELKVDPNMAFDLVPQDVHVNIGDTFVVTAAVENATDMYGWQVYVVFDPMVLQCTGVFLPSNRVFSSSVTVSSALTAYDDMEFQVGPLRHIQNGEGWVLAGDCLLGASQPTFYGSGVLCQIEFKAISPGSTTLALLHDTAHTFQTYSLDPNIQAVTSSSPFYSNIQVLSG